MTGYTHMTGRLIIGRDMKASELLTHLRQIQQGGLDLTEVEVEVFDLMTGQPIEIVDLGLTGDNVFQIKFDYSEG